MFYQANVASKSPAALNVNSFVFTARKSHSLRPDYFTCLKVDM